MNPEVVMSLFRMPGLRGFAPILLLMGACSPAAQAQSAHSNKASEPQEKTVVEFSPSMLSSAFRGASERALPAVVSIRVQEQPRISTWRTPPTFRFFPGFPDEITPIPREGQGSGFIFDERGYILTNHHVVRDADRVTVTMTSGREYDATVIGTDPNTDIAVIKIEPGRDALPVARLGDSDRLQVGDWVLALGNPLGLDFTVTAGIVSAKGRSLGIISREQGQMALEAFIQTDAAINPGNSGGPLVDLEGNVVGVNTAIASRTGYYAGYGFAIPIALAKRVASDLIEYGAVRRPRLGVSVADVTEADAEVYGLDKIAGAEVAAVQEGTPAAKAGIRLGDVIVELDGESIATASDLTMRLARRQPGETVELTLIRDRKERKLKVELGEFETGEPRRNVRQAAAEIGDILGFQAAPVTPAQAREFGISEASGLVITRVQPASPAANAGLQPGLLLRRLNGKEITNSRDLERAAKGIKPGDVVSVIVEVPGGDQTIINYRTRR